MQLIDTELFKNIDPSCLNKLEKCLRLHVMQYKKNETVCSYGSGSDRIGIVLAGRAAIFRTDYNGYESLLENLPEGSIFSESMSFFRYIGLRFFSGIFTTWTKNCWCYFVASPQITNKYSCFS